MHLYVVFNRQSEARILDPEHRLHHADRIVPCHLLADVTHAVDDGEESALVTVKWMQHHLCLGIGVAKDRRSCRDWRFVIASDTGGTQPTEVKVSEPIKDDVLLTALNERVHTHYAST